MKSRYYLILGVSLGLIVVLSLGMSLQPYQYQGSLINPATTAADFVLTDQNGGTFRLADQKGKVVLLFFGYTHCTDVCPVTLAEFLQIRSALDNQGQAIGFVFITVDPERDSTDVLAKYIDSFDPSFFGLTGSMSSLESVWSNYGVYRLVNNENGSTDYSVDHSTRIYVVDQNGNLKLTYPYGFEVQKVIQDLQHLLGKG